MICYDIVLSKKFKVHSRVGRGQTKAESTIVYIYKS